MQKIAAILLPVLLTNIVYSQKTETASGFLKANKLAEAKIEIDNVLALPANQKNAEAFYTKAKIYVAISQDRQLSKQYPGARMDAFHALKKYTELDTKMLIALQMDGFKPINDIYTGFFSAASDAFNKGDYSHALTDYNNAIAVSRFMNEKNWIRMPIDTTAVLYAGVSSEKLSKLDGALYYYGLLVKAKAKGENFVEIYKWVANQYYEKKDYADAIFFTKIGKEVYPNDPFWISMELDLTRVTGSREQLFAMYEDIISKYPDNYLYMYNYAVELYQYGHNSNLTPGPANADEIINKAEAMLRSVIRLKPDYANAQLFAGQILYNKAAESSLTKGTGPVDEKLKTEVKKYFDEAIPYLLEVEKIYIAKPSLTATEKANLMEAYDLLVIIYSKKDMPGKSKEYDTKYNKLADAKK